MRSGWREDRAHFGGTFVSSFDSGFSPNAGVSSGFMPPF
jgi:hypothetical protein